MIDLSLCNDIERVLPNYRMQCDLKSLAVNISDIGVIKLAFRLSVFQETRDFRCVNTASKKDWPGRFD